MSPELIIGCTDGKADEACGAAVEKAFIDRYRTRFIV